ncbi:MAG: PDZ domain-containing protein [Planctomycetes bacterium]|nr:PDZ domain-containing protein [Planctomycetota bacterium]
MNSKLRLGLVLLALSGSAFAQTKLLRFPDVHGDRVAFCYGGDIWTASTAGGAATRITAHPGVEVFPRFSPDGQWIAFTGQYDGDEQVYVVPIGGGVPRQLTWYPARGPLTARWGWDNQVYGWSKDSKQVLFRSMSEGWDLTDTRLYLVSIDGGLPKPLAMPVAGGGDLSPDEKKVVYSPLTRDFRTWKRYEGGWAQDLYTFDLASHALEPVAHSIRTERDPMWIGEQIWFVSDRDGFLNLYSFDLASKKVEQATKNTGVDVRWAARGEAGEIVYELGGELHLYDTKKKADRKLDIRVPTDGLSARPSTIHVGDGIENFDVSPKGERALFCARGDVFTAPIEKGVPRNLTHSSRSHEKRAAWSPDGSTIAFISDASGEEELWTVAQDGSTAPERLSTDGHTMRNDPRWSPDGKSIATSDVTGRLYVYSLATKTGREVAHDPAGDLGDYSWSPDSRWLAFTLDDSNGYGSIWIWGADDAQLHRVTDEFFDESEPVWDPKGNYLYYLCDREFAPQLNLLEWNFSVTRSTGLFALALKKDTPHPFPPQSDEVTVAKKDDEKKAADAKGDAKPEAKSDAKPDAKDDKKPDDKSDAKKDEAPPKVDIDFDGLAARVVRVPIDADNYQGLSANAEHLFVTRGGAPFYGRESERQTALIAYELKERKPTTVVDSVNGYVLSSDGSKLLVAEGGAFQLYDASAKGKDSKKTVSTAELTVDRVPADEWAEVFDEVWRRYRDFFYCDNMHGYDWKALRAQYAALLPHVAHRADLNYVLGEMIAELNIGHAYVTGGDFDIPPRPSVGLLGCLFELDVAVGRYKITRILPGQNDEARYRSPLTEVGVDVKVGEYVLAIDGVDLAANDSPYRLLRNKADRPVELLVGQTADPARARKVKVSPRDSESDLFYFAWVAESRERVAKLSNGRLAYIHIPDMGADGIREFIKWYYGQVRKDGLIVDDRNNGGGNVSQMILERLRRVLLGTGYARNNENVETYPQVVFNGPMVCLLNENSASDGDIFPWMFREAKLGPLVGKRSWGGVTGISDHGPLIDGGSVSVPEFGHANAKGQWAVEGWGVEPDVVVENDAKSILDGRDPQLEKAVELLMADLAKRASGLPPRPAAPVKTPAPIKQR